MTTEIHVKVTQFDQRVAIVRLLNLDYQQIDSDKLQGVIRNPFAFYFPIQRGFSGSIQMLSLCSDTATTGPPYKLMVECVTISASQFNRMFAKKLLSSFRDLTQHRRIDGALGAFPLLVPSESAHMFSE